MTFNPYLGPDYDDRYSFMGMRPGGPHGGLRTFGASAVDAASILAQQGQQAADSFALMAATQQAANYASQAGQAAGFGSGCGNGYGGSPYGYGGSPYGSPYGSPLCGPFGSPGFAGPNIRGGFTPPPVPWAGTNGGWGAQHGVPGLLGNGGCSPCGGQLQTAMAMAELDRLGPWAQARLLPGIDPALVKESARGKDLIYGFDSGDTAIAIAMTATLSTAPQKRHIPIRLVISSTMADNFALSAISVGVEPVLATVGNLSMAIFVEDSTTPDFRAVVCEVGNDVSLIVTNISAAPQRFLATMVGRELPPPSDNFFRR